jgi:hypothetical protein
MYRKSNDFFKKYILLLIVLFFLNSNADLLGLKKGDMVVSMLGDGEGSSNSDLLFSKKRDSGTMIQLLSTEDMYPIRLVAIRSHPEKRLPSLINNPTQDDYDVSEADLQQKNSLPDYMKSISTGEDKMRKQREKYRQQVAEQRKVLMSRERRIKERKRLSKRVDIVKKRELNVKQRRRQELNAACDDTEEAWLNWDSNASITSSLSNKGLN